MNMYLLVKGISELAFFRRLLPADLKSVTTIVTSGGRSNIVSKARSLMVTKRKPLVLVTDANVIEKDAVEQRHQSLHELLRSATAGVPFKVVLAVPEIESWFFDVPEVVERLSGKQLSLEQRQLGEIRPKEALSQIFKAQVSVAHLADELTEKEVQALRESYPRKDLIEFLEDHVKKSEPQPA